MTTSNLLDNSPTKFKSAKSVAGLRIDLEVLQAVAVSVDAVILMFIGIIADRFIVGQEHWWSDSASMAVFSAVVFITTVAVRGGYKIDTLVSPQAQIGHLAIAWAVVFFILAWVAFIFKISANFSRLGVSFFFVVGAISLTTVHVSTAIILRSWLARGKIHLQNIFAVVFGDIGELENIFSDLPSQGMNIVGYQLIAPNVKSVSAECSRLEDRIRETLSNTRCDSVLVFAPWTNQRLIAELLEAIKPFPTPAVLIADRAASRVIGQKRVEVGSWQGFEVQRAPLSRTDRALKRLLDLMVASAALIILALPMVLTGVAILVETGFPVFFRQDRKGFGGRVFQILKFRSMTVQENGPDIAQAKRSDPRITPLGRVLRRTSIDELPQLINVLRGEMSIVGPRPHAIAHDNQYDEQIATYAFRHHVKPGITGWAQINGHRGETRELGDMEARVAHDLWYINHWSIWLDIRIIAQTAAMVLVDKNAY